MEYSDMNLIIPQLFLGNWMAARDSAVLKRNGISYILIVAEGFTAQFPTVCLLFCCLVVVLTQ